MMYTEPGTEFDILEVAAGHMRVLGHDERASFHQLHATVAAEKSNSCRTLWSILCSLEKASGDDLKKLKELYDDSFAGPDGSKPRLATAKATRAPEVGPGDGRPAEPRVREDAAHAKAPRHCDVCKIWLNGKIQYEDHLAGEKHRKNAAAAEAPKTKPASGAGELLRRYPTVYQ